MKELTTEQKAQRYDEALDRAEECHIDGLSLHQPVKEVIEYIFPELAESEDEKIRKAIKYGLNYVFTNNTTIFEVTKEQCLAWLEKQSKRTNWKPSKDEMDALYGLAYITNKMDDKKDEAITKLYQDLKREFFNGSSYENMFPNTEDGVRRRSTIQVLEYARSLDTYNQYGKADIDKNIAWLEKQGVQKPAGKIEPKFHEGEWITNGDYTWKIVEVKPLDYILQSQDGNIVDDTISHVDKQFHSFTIEDAKDGDVLIDKSNGRECPFIFKETKPSDIKTDCLNPLTVLGYCGIGGAGFTKGRAWGDTANCIYYPATKEQRDTLFAKMKEAGYEWNAEKKELKKIEQKSEWSEEDNHRIKDAIYFLDTAKKHYASTVEIDACIDWLKSLKQNKV